MFGSDVTSHVRHLRLMNEFDKFAAKEGDTLESVYERLTTLVNIMDCNNVRPILVSINTKFLNCLQPEWIKYVTMCIPLTESTLEKENVQCYNYNEKGHYACDGQKPRVRDAKYFREQMLLAMKDEAGSNLKNEENDFMLDNSYGEETIEELTAAVMLMARIQPGDGNTETVPSYDAKTVSEVNASSKVHEQNQDLLITIFELKNKLQTVDKEKNVNTKFNKSETSRTLLCVTPLPKNIVVKAKKVSNTKVIQLVFWIVDIRCSKHMTGNLQLLRTFVEKFTRTVRFGNDHFAVITGYRDYVQGNLMICHVYYIEGLEVAFRSNTCYVRDLEGDDLHTGSRDSNLYTIFISEMASSSLMCLISRATSTKYWLWHRMLSHLNFGTINQLMSKDLVDGFLKFKYNKDHLCSVCEQGKSKKASVPPKLVPSIESKLELLHMNLRGPMRVASINGKKYILVIIDDYSRYTWADIGIFIGYSESSRGFHIYNRRTKKIMEMIHVKFDELTPMAFECNNLEPKINCMNFQDSLEDSQSLPSKIDLDNLFGPLYEEYYATRSPEVSDNSAANTPYNETLLHHRQLSLKKMKLLK
nr:retrovirus-related Pol polyprotein from transposon TNT 1-94 [Tanacetum cinerariifolium]